MVVMTSKPWFNFRGRKGESRGYVQVTSADPCRIKRTEGVGTVELVNVGRLLRMDDDSLLVHVWRSVGD